MEKRDYQKEFCCLIDRYAYRYSRWQIWNDFLYLSAAALANVFPIPEREEREKQYLSVIGRYTVEEQKIFPEMLTIAGGINEVWGKGDGKLSPLKKINESNRRILK